ncbi:MULTISPECIES: coiled-coil domain-containing protein [Micrococcaceae]|uniref:Uncharacterized protein n=1 Tax=Arthrobacter rhombi TaxID=71253 RepID=A0A1R4FMY0_9MICC|nr:MULTISPECIES: hypothetical protein [Micrococcaceae]PCC25353.1 hypothetical protein CIK75_10150 [Glutamicibacter sp. BW78]SJM57239.1 hypothetical protein FM101_04835 [Arthrobacter rhombi]
MEQVTEHPEATPHSKAPRPSRKWIAGVGAAVVLLAAGAWAGSAVTDPTTSEQYASLKSELTTTAAERDSVQAQLDETTSDYETLSGEIDDRELAADEKEAALDQRSEELDEQQSAVTKREKAVGTAEKEKAANTVTGGTWTVGLDIAAGTYRADEPVDSDCYWAIMRTGSNGDLIENDIPGGGRPSVTLSKGQDFNTSRCGSWTKQ